VTLLVTLSMIIMLRVDLSEEDVGQVGWRAPLSRPCVREGVRVSEAAVGQGFLDAILFLTNAILPAASLAIGVVWKGVSAGEELQHTVRALNDSYAKTQNPIHRNSKDDGSEVAHE
jgi:hypothetical protein